MRAVEAQRQLGQILEREAAGAALRCDDSVSQACHTVRNIGDRDIGCVSHRQFRNRQSVLDRAEAQEAGTADCPRAHAANP